MGASGRTFMTNGSFPKTPKAISLPWNKGEYFRDFAPRVPVKNWAAAKDKLLFFLDSGDRNEKNGYRLLITRVEKTWTLEAQGRAPLAGAVNRWRGFHGGARSP